MTQAKAIPGASGDLVGDIEKFQRYHGFDKVKVTFKFLVNQLNFLAEELREAGDALEGRDADALYDSIIDIIVVAVGTAEFMARGRTREGWVRVMNKNFQKTVGYNAKRPNSGGVDLIKPDGWTPPDHRDLVADLQDLLNRVTQDELDSVVLLDHRGEPVGAATGPQEERESVRVLRECIEIHLRKAQDYNNDLSGVTVADYYPNGLDDFEYIIDTLKRLRQRSQIEALRHNPGHTANYEGLEDTLKDRIIYTAMAVEFIRGKMPGQDPRRDLFGRTAEEPRQLKAGAIMAYDERGDLAPFKGGTFDGAKVKGEQ